MASGRIIRTPLAAAPAVGTIVLAWALLERPVAWATFAALALLALAPTIPTGDVRRVALAGGATVGALAIGFDTWPHRALGEAWSALHAAPAVRAPFDPLGFPSLHGLVACSARKASIAAMPRAASRRSCARWWRRGAGGPFSCQAR